MQSPARSMLLTLAAAIAIVLAGCGERAGEAKAAASGPPAAPPVSVAAAMQRDVLESDEFPGRVEAIEQVEVRARVSGYLQAIHFEPGAEVKKGDRLFTIDPRPFEAQVAAAESQVASTRAQLALARIDLARNERMWADRATSKREVDDAATRVRTLESQLRANDAVLLSARLNLGYTRINSPIAGRVSKAEITTGNLVQGELPSSPLLTTVVSTNPVYVSFQADESAYLKYIAGAREGALAIAVGLADEDGFPHAAKLEFVDNRVDPTSGTVRMRATVENQDGRFTPGLFARVKLADSERPRKAVLVADRAIGTDQNKRYVLVIGENNAAQYREVEVGRVVGGLRIIESGLVPGEKIVVNGLQRVRPGTPVTPQLVSMEGEPAPKARTQAAARARTQAANAPPTEPATDARTLTATHRDTPNTANSDAHAATKGDTRSATGSDAQTATNSAAPTAPADRAKLANKERQAS